MKRLFDIIISSAGLFLLFPLTLFLALLIKADTRGPVFFRQERMGKRFTPFYIYKFRTMTHDPANRGQAITVGNDPRVTRIGRFLRLTKFDEFPQLLNVLRGDMSLVGPRPEVRQFVELFQDDYATILKVRPGITDLASLKYRNESSLLETYDDPHEEYIKRLLPDKIRLAKEYIARSSILFDISILLRTVAKLFESGPAKSR